MQSSLKRYLDPQVLKTIFQPLTPDRQEDLVKRLEQIARDHPQHYRLQVGGLAILGYLYILLIFTGLGIGLWILRQLCIAFDQEELLSSLYLIALIVGLVILRMFWLTIPKPKGIQLTPDMAPQLFNMIQELTQNLQTPPIHRILIIEDLNAAILQRPRLGILGWFENTLLLGLPLLQVLSPPQVKAVIAHELGHLSGNHSRFRNWIYRIRRTWLELSGRVDRQDATGWFFKRFFHWYGPFFNAYSFVLARANEYEADQIAATQAGINPAAEALIRTNLYGYHWSTQAQIWSSKQAANSPEPPAQKISILLDQIQNLSDQQAQRWYAIALSEETDTEDTHPSLSDRLQALGYTTDPQYLPDPLDQIAAQVFLGDQIQAIAQQLDQLWQKEQAQTWKILHELTKVQAETLRDLGKKSMMQGLTSMEAWKQAYLLQSLQADQPIRPLLESILRRDPDHGLSHYQLGLMLLKQGDPEGAHHLEKAMELDPALVISAGERLAQYYRSRDEKQQVEIFEKRIRDHQPIWEQAIRARLQISPRDLFKSPELSPDQIQQIGNALSYYPDIRSAYLVQKPIQHFPARPVFILGIDRQFLSGQGPDRKSDREVIQELMIRISLPGDLIIEALDPSTLNLFNALKRIQGAQIL